METRKRILSQLVIHRRADRVGAREKKTRNFLSGISPSCLRKLRVEKTIYRTRRVFKCLLRQPLGMIGANRITGDLFSTHERVLHLTLH